MFVLICKPIDKYTTARMLLNIEVFPVILLLEITEYQEFQNMKMRICIMILAAEIAVPNLS